MKDDQHKTTLGVAKRQLGLAGIYAGLHDEPGHVVGSGLVLVASAGFHDTPSERRQSL